MMGGVGQGNIDLDRGEILDSLGRTQGTIDHDGTVRDSNNNSVGNYIRVNSEFRDNNGNSIAKVNRLNGDVEDRGGRRIAGAD